MCATVIPSAETWAFSEALMIQMLSLNISKVRCQATLPSRAPAYGVAEVLITEGNNSPPAMTNS